MAEDDGDMRTQARQLRDREGLSGRQIQERLKVNKITLREWLRDIPPPGADRPGAQDERRAAAVELRGQGWSVNDIALEVGAARSTAWRWVKHLPLDRDSERATQKRAKGKQLTDGRWWAHRVERDARRDRLRAHGARVVGELSERELLLLGAATYWCEGAKSKPWRPNDIGVMFTNSDPDLVALFVRFLESVGVSRDRPSYRVAIHESADVHRATLWWSECLDLPLHRFLQPTLKRHNPKTNRHNTAESYHGCLIIKVPRGRDLYWRIEGVMRGMVGGTAVDTGAHGCDDDEAVAR